MPGTVFDVLRSGTVPGSKKCSPVLFDRPSRPRFSRYHLFTFTLRLPQGYTPVVPIQECYGV